MNTIQKRVEAPSIGIVPEPVGPRSFQAQLEPGGGFSEAVGLQQRLIGWRRQGLTEKCKAVGRGGESGDDAVGDDQTGLKQARTVAYLGAN